jgi:predicted nucleic acid-binding protein
MLIYLDTNIVVYTVENTPGFGPKARLRLDTARRSGDHFAVSDLVRMECCSHPFARGDTALLAVYDAFFNLPEVQFVPIDTSVFRRATVIRGHGFRTVDALHLAAAAEAGCGLFLTNDTRLSRFVDVPVEVLA